MGRAVSLPRSLFALKHPSLGASQVALVVKNPPANTRHRRHGFDPWIGKIWRRKWQPTSVFLPGKSHGERNLEATVHPVAKNWTWLSGQACTCPSPGAYSLWVRPGLGANDSVRQPPGVFTWLNIPQYVCHPCPCTQGKPSSRLSRKLFKTSRQVWLSLLSNGCFCSGSWYAWDFVCTLGVHGIFVCIRVKSMFPPILWGSCS